MQLRSRVFLLVIERSKEISIERLNEMIQQYKCINEIEDIEQGIQQGDIKPNVDSDYEALKKANSELLKKVQELEAKLKALEKPKDDFLSKHGYKLVGDKEKPKMPKEVLTTNSKH
ncbi:MAG: hypothetical protein Q7T55_05980, partial [Solirubrobacteraceae bacterium]|nr:hypothetical protein [Solirubrobacteraceae bacterium]